MSKVLLIGDTHNGANGNSPRLLQQNIDLYKKFILPIIKQYNIDFAIDLGDFFDDREKIDIKTLKTVREEMLNDLPVPFYFIVGNHNQYYKSNNLLNNLVGTIGDLDNVHIVDRFTQIDNIDIFPWITPNNVETYLKCIEMTEGRFACGHFEFNGFPFDKSRTAEVKERMSATSFKKYEAVFSGHYHIASQKDNIIYVGSPVQLTWIDVNVEKRVIVLDTTTGDWQDIVNPDNLYFQYTITNEDSLRGINPEFIRNKRVKIYYDVNLDKDLINNAQAILKTYEPDQLNFIPQGQKKKEEQLIVEIQAGLEQAFKQYIDMMPLDNSRIRPIVEKCIMSYYNKASKKE